MYVCMYVYMIECIYVYFMHACMYVFMYVRTAASFPLEIHSGSGFADFSIWFLVVGLRGIRAERALDLFWLPSPGIFEELSDGIGFV